MVQANFLVRHDFIGEGRDFHEMGELWSSGKGFRGKTVRSMAEHVIENFRFVLIFLDEFIVRNDVAEGRISGDNDRIRHDLIYISPPAVGFRRRVGTGRVEFQQGLQGAISDLDNVGIVGQDGLFRGLVFHFR
uniref:Uncharacterized protein n=2 Tax=unclassified Caudoviricetes TaxID=2788787 RepID=A0A8S5Q8R3_9CAUD|nr:MAG TPA: hypothetical protein [Siphoviridae sp. ctAvK3]DAE15141.1 MAG TPA: hypothetical protein [Siphoviridae sp. ctdVv30]